MFLNKLGQSGFPFGTLEPISIQFVIRKLSYDQMIACRAAAIYYLMLKKTDMLRYWTAGESHGKCLLALVDGFPAGFEIDPEKIDRLLRLRQGGYGRGGRQKLETDRVEILTGVWKNVTLGGPITLQVVNSDYKLERLKELPRPRPGHGDLSGSIKYLSSMRGILERASARETCVRVAAGGLCQQLLQAFGIRVLGYVVELGSMKIKPRDGDMDQRLAWRDESIIYSLDPGQDQEAKSLVDQPRADGDTLGGIVEVVVDPSAKS